MVEKIIAALIIEAINLDDEERIRVLVSANPDQIDAHTFMSGQKWLGYAAQKGKLRASKALVVAGFSVNCGDAHCGAKPICSAASNAEYEVASFLLGAGSDLDVDASVKNPLFAAIVGRSPKVVALILEAGIDSRVRYDSGTMKDMDAVAFALMRGERECAEIIARRNAEGDESIASAVLQQADKIAEENAHLARVLAVRRQLVSTSMR